MKRVYRRSVTKGSRFFLNIGFLIVCGVLLHHSLGRAQGRREPGRSIGTVTTKGNLIVMELDEGVLGKANLFDLDRHTLRFMPDGPGYRVENAALQWDTEFGTELTGSQVTLHNFKFPYSGETWDAFSVGATGSISFGPSGGSRGGGLSIGRFDQLLQAARKLINTVPAICVFLKPRMSGPRYVKELADRVVITWDSTEPLGGIQDFTWVKTINRFQAALRRDGVIEMSYNQVAAKDAIVGLYPVVTAGSGIRGPEAHLSSLTRQDGPFTTIYESFHYLALPNPRNLACTVIKALGDKFDFLAYYSDFRVDNQEAGTPSNGPLGGNVTGIGQTQRGLESYCSNGRFQWQFIQPVYVGSNQMQERPPDGATGNNHDIAFYARQLGERSPDGKMLGYNLAMSQIGHEMGHRWAAFVSANAHGETIVLGPTHWARGLQAPAAFPYQRPTEASAMGGGVWQDNFDGAYTQLDDDYYVPATGWSHLDLYLMGLITPSEVPNFFLLRNLVAAGSDANGHPIFKADKVKITIQDVISAQGPRLPAVDQSQKNFNTGIVVIVEHGAKPSHELIERANGIREKWIDYWATTTGHRSSMTVDPGTLSSGAQHKQDVVRPAASSR
jgi:hypothetical protein